MNEEEKYFDYSMIPGKELNLNQSINDKEPIISITVSYTHLTLPTKLEV